MNAPIKSFSELGIKSENQLSGVKIGINHVLNKAIKVNDFRVGKSKFTEIGNGKLLTIQIEVDGEERIIFTSSNILHDQLEKIRAVNGFPCMATIIPLTPRGYKFT